MENIDKLKIIAGQVNDLKKIIQKFDEQPGNIHQIDLDLTFEKVRRIYENLLQLNAMSQIAETTKGRAYSREIQKDETVKVISETDAGSVPEPVEEKKNAQINDHTEKEHSPSLFDLFPAKPAQVKGKEKKSVVEKMADEKPVEIIAEKIGKKKIPSLNQAIGINEKFFFINELFEGNMKGYKTAIDGLDQSETLSAASEYLQILVNKYGWGESNEAYIMLLGFVERRFS